MTSVTLPAWFVRDATKREVALCENFPDSRSKVDQLNVMYGMANAAMSITRADQGSYIDVSFEHFALFSEASSLIIEERGDAARKRIDEANLSRPVRPPSDQAGDNWKTA